MLNSKKLNELIMEHSGDVKSFATENGIKYTTLWNNLQSDAQLSHMKIEMFMAVSDGLGMTTEDLIKELKM